MTSHPPLRYLLFRFLSISICFPCLRILVVSKGRQAEQKSNESTFCQSLLILSKHSFKTRTLNKGYSIFKGAKISSSEQKSLRYKNGLRPSTTQSYPISYFFRIGGRCQIPNFLPEINIEGPNTPPHLSCCSLPPALV